MNNKKSILDTIENPFTLDFASYNVYGERVGSKKALKENANYKGDYKGYSIYKEVCGGWWCQRGYTDQCWDAEFESLSELKKYIDEHAEDYEESLKEGYDLAYRRMDRYMPDDAAKDFGKITTANEMAEFIKANINDEEAFYELIGKDGTLEGFAKYIIDNKLNESLIEAKEEACCICGEPIDGYGNNPEPYKHEGRCCDACNLKFVIPARMAQLGNKE